MRWRKLGQVFDPQEHVLPFGCKEFAQSPQVLLFDDCARVYFSTRSRDEASGKYRSHIAFVDMTKTFDKVLRVSDHTVIELGTQGCFDEHGIFPMNVVRNGNVVHGYTCGWNRRVSVSIDTAIGLATSNDDGVTFQRVGDGPILASTMGEPFLVGDPFVLHCHEQWHMWYIFGVRWAQFMPDAPPDRVYKIGQASSTDGVSWHREPGRQIVADRLGVDECQALPTVVHFRGRWHMFFCYRESSDFRTNSSRSYRIGHAVSDDGATWDRNDSKPGIDVTEGAWDSDMMCYPHVFACDDAVYMLYNGNEFGRYGFGLAVLE